MELCYEPGHGGCLDLDWSVYKQHTSQNELKYVALSTIHNRYPSDNWLHVYTDGSAENAIKNAGAGAYSNIFSISYPVGKYCDNFDGEIAAIIYAIDELRNSEV